MSKRTPETTKCPECGCRNDWHVGGCLTGMAALEVIEAVAKLHCK